jgi:hypothetical protein
MRWLSLFSGNNQVKAVLDECAFGSQFSDELDMRVSQLLPGSLVVWVDCRFKILDVLAQIKSLTAD